MNDPEHRDQAAASSDAAEEVVDGVPVLAGDARPAAPARPAGVPTAAVAGASFLAGLTAVSLLRGRVARRAARRALGLGRRRRRRGRVEVLATRSFLVDVHVVQRR